MPTILQAPAERLATTSLPPPAPPPPAAELAADHACGPFNTSEIDDEDHPLLLGRVLVRSLPGGDASPHAEQGNVQVAREGAILFIGARETYVRGDEHFDRRAAAVTRFRGTHDVRAIPGRDGETTIVTGLIREPRSETDKVPSPRASSSTKTGM